MIFDDFLFAIILAGFALAAAYLRSEYASHMRSKAEERSKNRIPHNPRAMRAGLEQNGIVVRVRIAHSPRCTGATSLKIYEYSATVLLFLFCACASGADADLLYPGMRVRISATDASPSKIIGTIDHVSDDTLTLNIPGRNDPVSISRSKILRLEVSDGPGSRGLDSLIGALIGGGLGAIACAVSNSGSEYGHIVSTGEVAGICALLGGGLGAAIGAVIPPGERWKQAAEARYRVSFAPRVDHGMDLAVAWKF